MSESEFMKVDEAAHQVGCSPDELLEAAIDGQLSFAIYSHSDIVKTGTMTEKGKMKLNSASERRTVGEWIYPERAALRMLLDNGELTTGAFCSSASASADLWMENKRSLTRADLWVERSVLKTFTARAKDTINPRRERTLLATITVLDAMVDELTSELETHARKVLSENGNRAPSSAGWADLFRVANGAKKRFTIEKMAERLKAHGLDVSHTSVKNVMADARKIQPKT